MCARHKFFCKNYPHTPTLAAKPLIQTVCAWGYVPHSAPRPHKNRRHDMELRDYQRECIKTIEAQAPGSYLCQMATGLGKTVTFANIPRQGRNLILSHREELVRQPMKYYDCSYGVERAGEHSHGEEVVSASVQTLVRRLEQFSPDAFDTIIVDEAHHAAANTYRKILDYFKPRLTLGFTATPNRGDKVRLDTVFSDIIFARDLRFGIQNGYLCDIYCMRVDIGYDLSAVHTRAGDYAPGELDEAMEGTADAIAEAYGKYAKGATLIFAVSVHHANEIAAKIPGAVVVTGETKDRAAIIERFTAGEIPCIVNCMVFTEGTDIPRVETVIIARPTQSDSLYMAEGLGEGFDDQFKDVKKAIESNMNFDAANASINVSGNVQRQVGGVAAAAQTAQSNNDRSIHLTVVAPNGKELARFIAPYMGAQLQLVRG